MSKRGTCPLHTVTWQPPDAKCPACMLVEMRGLFVALAEITPRTSRFLDLVTRAAKL